MKRAEKHVESAREKKTQFCQTSNTAKGSSIPITERLRRARHGFQRPRIGFCVPWGADAPFVFCPNQIYLGAKKKTATSRPARPTLDRCAQRVLIWARK